MARGEQLSRQWRILELLRQGPRSRDDIARELCVSTKTIKRDVEDVLVLFFPIVVEPDSNIVFYRYLKEANLPIPALSFEEHKALVLSRELIKDALGELPFASSLSSAIDRIVNTQAERQRRRKESLPQVYHSDFAIPDEESLYQHHLERAAVERRAVRILYQHRERREDTRRIVEPLALHLSVRGLQLLAFCRLREAVRVFAVRSIRQIELLNDTFDPKEHLDDLQHYLDHSFDGYRDGDVEEVHFVVRGECANWAGHRQYHPTQRIEEREDGSISIRFHACGEKAIVRKLLMFGPDCEVITPLSLKRAHHEMVQQMAKAFGKQ